MPPAPHMGGRCTACGDAPARRRTSIQLRRARARNHRAPRSRAVAMQEELRSTRSSTDCAAARLAMPCSARRLPSTSPGRDGPCHTPARKTRGTAAAAVAATPTERAAVHQSAWLEGGMISARSASVFCVFLCRALFSHALFPHTDTPLRSARVCVASSKY